MEAPVAGAAVTNVPSGGQSGAPAARPSNFSSFIEGGGSESSGQTYAPRESQAWGDAQPRTQDRAARGDLEQPAIDPRNAPVDADNPLADPNAQPEQLYDPETGEPVDMAAYEAQRQEVLGRIQTAIEDGRFPFEELKGLPVEVTINGETREVPLEEVKEGYQRRADYSRKLQEAHALRDQAQHVLNLERARNMEWRDPAQLRAGLKMLGLEESFMRAAYGWAEERVAYNRLPPRERQLYDHMQQERAEKMQMQAQMRQQQMQVQQQAGPDPATMHVAKQIEQLMPRAFRAHGIGAYPLAQQTFLQQLQAFCGDGEVTPQRVNDAAIATKEFLADLAKINAGQMPAGRNAMQQLEAPEPQQQARPAYPLGPRRLAPGSRPQLVMGSVMGQGQGATGRGEGRRPSDFIKRHGLG
jgi:hypothetical protein